MFHKILILVYFLIYDKIVVCKKIKLKIELKFPYVLFKQLKQEYN